MSIASINFNKITGKMKPMHAVNNGPCVAGPNQTRGNQDYYGAVEFPYARTHDASFSAHYGLEHTVDVHNIFSNATNEINYQDPPSIDTIKSFLKSFSFFIEPELIKIARENTTNKPVGFSLTLPDANQIFKKTKGKINMNTN